jgi:hypothetical protein
MRTSASERNNDVRSVATASNVLAWLCLTDEPLPLARRILHQNSGRACGHSAVSQAARITQDPKMVPVSRHPAVTKRRLR